MHKIFPKWYFGKFINSEYENDTTPYEVDYITGADLFIRRKTIDECGMFDEEFFMYSEECEMQFRFKKAGYKSVIIPTINIIHYCGLPMENISPQKLKMYLESDILFHKKCYGRLSAFAAKILHLIKYIVTPRFNGYYFEYIKTIIKL